MDASAGPSPAQDQANPSVTSLELFFDLVFVFTITQLTTVLAREPNWTSLLQLTLIFGNVWWMYGGYAWLTNAIPPRELGVRLLLLISMGGFLVIALAIPTAFGAGGIAFGVGYLTVTLVHAGIFLRTSQQSVIEAVKRLGPFNLVTAAMLLVAGFTSGGARWALFAAAFAVHWVTPHITGIGGFRIRSPHFVERHGLILLIAIGESVVALGIGLGAIELPVGRIAAALLGLALAAELWWLYFNGEEDRAESALEAAPEHRRPWLAVNAFGYGFLPILGGVVLIAAGIKLAVLRYEQPATLPTALLLAVGLALYLAGLALFRLLLRSGSVTIRLLLAALALPTAFIGLGISPLAQLTALAVLIVAGTVAESARVNPTS